MFSHALMYVYPIHASVISSSWGNLLSYTLCVDVILCLFMLNIMPLKFFRAYLVKYLYTSSPNLY